VISGGFLKLESLEFLMTPSPNEIVREKCGQNPCRKQRQRTAMDLPEFVAMAYEALPPFFAFWHPTLPALVAVCRNHGVV